MASPESRTSSSPDPIRDLLDEKSLAEEITKAIEGNDCPEDRELEGYVRKELREPERIEVKSHLTFCGRCQKRVNEIASSPTQKALAPPPGKSFRGYRLPTPSQEPRRPFPVFRAAVVGASALALGIGAYLIWFQSGSDFPYSGKVVHAEGADGLHAGRPSFYQLRTPRQIYLIEITIDGDGRIGSRIPGGPREGKYADGDRLTFTPRAPGEFDLYLVPCPASEGFPNRLHGGLLEFLKTEKAVSRENQRGGIEMALGLYRTSFIHEVMKVLP